MWKTVLFYTIVMSLFQSAASAQGQTEYELRHRSAETERQTIVADNLPLLDSEVEAFWALYFEYRAATKDMDGRRGKLLRRYAETYEDLAGDEGKRLVTDALRVEERRQTFKKRYLKKFARVLPGQRLFRYYQIETKLDAMHRFGWTRLIPLASVTE